MRLFYSEYSPYVRKVRVVAAEKNIALELLPTTPFENDPEFLRVNPLGKIPALVTDEGIAYSDSTVICEYFNAMKPKPALYPNDGYARLSVMQREYLALGLIDAAVKLIIESRRPKGTEWDVWVQRQNNAILRGCDVLEKEAAQFGSDPFADQITLGCALAYVDIRHSHLNWRDKHPQLQKWFEKFSERKSMRDTMVKQTQAA